MLRRQIYLSFLLLFIFSLAIMIHSSRKEFQVSDVKIANHNNYSTISPSISSNKVRNNKITMIEEYDYNLSFIDTTINLTESLILNSSTNLLIQNSVVYFSPSDTYSEVRLTIGESSKVNITNSILALNDLALGGSSFDCLGSLISMVNSSIIGLGKNNNIPGFYIRNSQISIIESSFRLGYAGLIFQDSDTIEILNCTFNDILGFEGYGGIGIYGYNSENISIRGCTFNNTNYGIEFHNCHEIIIHNSYFGSNTFFGINIYPNTYYDQVYDITIKNNRFIDLTFGIAIIGNDVTIFNNVFSSIIRTGIYMSGRQFNVSSNILTDLRVGITTLDSLASHNTLLISSISDSIIYDNVFHQISSICVLIQNYDFPTIFSISENNFTNSRNGLMFRGNIGGRNSTERSWVVNNIFKNITEFSIQGESLDYLAHFQYTSFVRNAFINSSYPYTQFQSRYYYMDDVRWDNGFVGNYWEFFVNESRNFDEDSNQICDRLFVISIDHGQFDQSPLLSLEFVRNDFKLCSTHPPDLVRAQSELKGENSTLSWFIQVDNNSFLNILKNGEPYSFTQNESELIISLISLPEGVYNFSLIIWSDNQLYRDLVWIEILKDDFNVFTNIFIPLGALIFVVAIGTISILNIKRRNN